VYSPERMCFEDAVDGEVFLTVYVVLIPSVRVEKLSITNTEPDKCEGWKWVPIESLLESKMFCDTQRVLKTLRDKHII